MEAQRRDRKNIASIITINNGLLAEGPNQGISTTKRLIAARVAYATAIVWKHSKGTATKEERTKRKLSMLE